MTEKKPSVAKDVFAYLLTFVMLYIGVVSFMTLLWQIINVQFPDPAQFYYQNAYDAMRNAIASLIVVWPVFLIMSRVIDKDIAVHHEKADIWVRRWLTYLTIFVAAITMIIDLITLINSFLSGELTLPFGLKVLVVLLVSGAVFGYEFWNLKRDPSKGAKELTFMAVGSAAVVVLGIISGFIFVGSPAKARDIKLDAERLNALQSIQYQVVNYWDKTSALPESLVQLNDPITGFVLPVDPITKSSYEYVVNGPLSFDLCATFLRESPAGLAMPSYAYPMYDSFGNPINQDWSHEAGRDCFTRTIDPKLHATPKLVP